MADLAPPPVVVPVVPAAGENFSAGAPPPPPTTNFAVNVASETSMSNTSSLSSLSSTPPTSFADNASVASEPSKTESSSAPLVQDAIVALPLPPPPPSSEMTTPEPPLSASRARRARHSLPTYNLSKLSGTDGHGKRASKGDIVARRRSRSRRTTSSETLVGTDNNDDNAKEGQEAAAQLLIQDGIEALDLQWSMRGLSTPRAPRVSPKKPTKAAAAASSVARRIATRHSGQPAETLTTKLSSLGKRGRKTFEKGISRMSRELRRLQDTNEFAHIDEKPVKYTVWSKGKYVDPDEEVEEEEERPRKKVKAEKVVSEEPAPAAAAAAAAEPESQLDPKFPRVKKWYSKGLYAGQDTPADPLKVLNNAERKRIALIPELATPAKPNSALPFPIYNGLRLLMAGRDFKLPFDICNPLPTRGKPKPEEWRKITKNRFVGDAQQYWKKADMKNDFQSMCVCKPSDGCGDDCQNRIMLYECDDTNCRLGKELCSNRPFGELAERTKKGGPYRTGVEVMKTDDRGYGVRSNRCFEPNQIIVEYTGEIITEEECDRRMNEVYKDNENYYLMSFEQNMILDATTGSIARFVNHSCSPNCRMRKWTVAGQPRMALFAGDNPITTGEELTYDYKFAPFSAKNVQKCLCGSENCRGLLGPRQKEVKEPKASVKASVKAGKRKLKELLDGSGGGGKAGDKNSPSAKKRKIKAAAATKGAKKTTTAIKGTKVIKGVKGVKSTKGTKGTKVAKVVKSVAGGAGTKAKAVKAKASSSSSSPGGSTIKAKAASVSLHPDILAQMRANKAASSLKASAKGAAKGVAKRAATVIKKSVEKTISVKSKAAGAPTKGAAAPGKAAKKLTATTKQKKTTTTTKTTTTIRKSSAGVVKKYGQKKQRAKKVISAKYADLTTIFAAAGGNDENQAPIVARAQSTASSLSSLSSLGPDDDVVAPPPPAPAAQATASPLPSPRKGLDISRVANQIRVVPGSVSGKP